jgi:hypothetical protein
MSHIRRIEPEPPDDPIQIILDELRDCFEIMRLLSLRLARLEAQKSGHRPLARPREPS